MQNDMISCVISNAERFLHIKKKKRQDISISLLERVKARHVELGHSPY